MSKQRKKFFIGTSRKYGLFADALKELFDDHATIEAVTWSDYFDVDGGGGYTCDSLLKAVNQFEFAVFFITPDWSLKSKRPSFAATPNLWFEAGMFMSRYGKENVLLVEEKDDEYSEKILFLTDLKGFQPEIITLSKTIKSSISPSRKNIKSWENTADDLKNIILISLEKVKKYIEDNFSDNEERIYDTTSIKNRSLCYKEGRRIVENASEFLYSIVSYEEEYESHYKDGLFPFIEDKLRSLKHDSEFTAEKSKIMFKRWMNLANDRIAEHAVRILTEHSEYIEIRDTFCNFIEVLISESEVLILLPKPKSKHTIIGKGVLIKSNEIAREFMDWFDTQVPEPNKFIIDTVDKLKQYREAKWNLKNRRMDGDNNRCNACFGPLSKMPAKFMKTFKQNGLLRST